MSPAIAAVLLVLIILLVQMARNDEKWAFNNGICRACGSKLRLFDFDSQGGRGYICDRCGHVVWCSYDVDKVKRRKEK